MRARALRRWCLSLAAFFAVYFSLRTSRTAMNWLWYAVLSPLERGLGTLCGGLDVSVAEVLLLTALFSALIWLCNVPRRIAAARRRRVCALRQLLTAEAQRSATRAKKLAVLLESTLTTGNNLLKW